jgi:hypothetical protein
MAISLEVPNSTLGAYLVETVLRRAPEGAVAHCLRHHPHADAVELALPPEEETQGALAEIQRELESLRLYESKGSGALLRLRGDAAPLGFANMLRRAMMTLPRVLCCTSLGVRANEGALADEIVAHRFGQLALLAPAGLEESSAVLGPLAGPRVVRAADIVFADGVSVAPDFRQTPLQLLAAGQTLDVTLSLTRGRGEEHARFAAVVMPRVWPVVLSEGRQCRRARLERALELDPAARYGQEVDLEIETLGAPAADVFEETRAELLRELERLGQQVSSASAAGRAPQP